MVPDGYCNGQQHELMESRDTWKRMTKCQSRSGSNAIKLIYMCFKLGIIRLWVSWWFTDLHGCKIGTFKAVKLVNFWL